MTALRLACWAVTLTIITATPLDDYVNAPDPNYGYRYLTSIQGPNFGVYLLNMTSQKWLTDAVTTTPVWWHVVAVTIPSKIEYTDTAFLWIGDHSSTYDITMEEQFIQTMTALAVSTGTVCGVIYQVPFQPIVFKDDPDSKSRVEDAIIAWTWRKFLDNGTNPEILLRLPMTKVNLKCFNLL
uniref:NIDO domain-containing protein n=1 Tax=Biomphalaria glabrata TaxID=6526 RepID=A0A2C9LAQ3_BIOGL